MAALVAPGICRFTVNGTYAERPIANIVDMQIDTTGTTTDRDDACFRMAGVLLNQWTDDILPLVADNYQATSVSWVDLNSLTGSTGERTSTDAETWPASGEGTQAANSSAIAFRVDKSSVARRGQRQGRMYLVGVPESATEDGSPNTLIGGVVTAMNSALASFLDNIRQEDADPGNYQSRMVVVHTVEDVFESWSYVESLTVNGRLGTQVRRLRG